MAASFWNWLFRRDKKLRPIRKKHPSGNARVPLRVELLEDRTLLAQVNWISAVSGDWNVAANWSTGAVPGVNDDAVLPQSGITVSHTSVGTDSIRSLTANQSRVSLSNGSLTLASTSTVKDLTITGGTLTGAGNLTVTGQTVWSGGKMSGAGRTIAAGGLNLSGFVTLDTRILENQAVATLSTSAAVALPTIQMQNGAAIQNNSGAIWNIAADAFIVPVDASSLTFSNQGTLQKTTTTGAGYLGVNFTNTGSVAVQAGSLHLAGGGSTSGSFTFSPGATLGVATGAFAFNAGATLSGAGNFNLLSGTANFSTGLPVTFANLSQSGGTLTGADAVTITGATTWTGGTMSGSGLSLAQGTLTLGTNLTLAQRTLTYAGPTPWTMPSTNLFILQNGGTFNYANGTTSPTPSLSATMTVSLARDVNSDGKADLGDTLKYTVIINNSGTTTAENLVFEDILDLNTTLVPDSFVYATPLAAPLVTNADLQLIVAAARERWQAVGITAPQRAILDGAAFVLADLLDGQIAQSTGTTVHIDRNGGDHGWFVDQTPLEDASEFATMVSTTRRTASAGSPAAGRLDLLTAVVREMGALLEINPADAADLLGGPLASGTRNLPPASTALTQLRITSGFHALASYFQNATGFNEKWFEDRNKNFYALIPTGDLIQWNGISFATSKQTPVMNLGVLVYDDPTLIFNAQTGLSGASLATLSQLRLTYGFYTTGSYFQNAHGGNEKWFFDRTKAPFALLPNGDLIKWNNISFASSKLNPIANVSVLAYDDPTQLFNAPVTIAPATLTQMTQLRLANGFYTGGNYFQNAHGAGEKWFFDRAGAPYALTPTGDLVKWNGISFASSRLNPLANLGVLVYDDPTQLFNAPVTLSDATTEQLSQLRAAYGFYTTGNYYPNSLGAGEKWVFDRSGAPYAVTPTGDLIKWNGISFATSKVNPIANLGVLAYDDPTRLLKAAVTVPAAISALMSQYRTTYGFYTNGNYAQNVTGNKEKWFYDRTGAAFALIPTGELVKWNGISFASSKANPVTNLGPLVYDDPTLLFNAPAALANSIIDAMDQLRTLAGFYAKSSYFQNAHGNNEKWFFDRNGAPVALTPTGGLVKWNGISFASSKLNPITNLGVLVYDNPTLLFDAEPGLAGAVAPLGSLGAGQNLSFSFQAKINDFLPAGVKNVTNQGRISGTDTATSTAYPVVLTDDPAPPGASDPTVKDVIFTSLFDDPDLESAVQQTLGLAANHTVTAAEMLTLTGLSADSNKISTLQGLQFAINLQSLSLTPGDWSAPGILTSLSPLTGLANLKSLTLQNAGITNAHLPSLSGQQALQALDLRYNAISNIASVAGIAKLASLQLHGNPVSDYTPLAGKFVVTDQPVIDADSATSISALADALYKAPILMYQYVLNKIENEFYVGVLKGAQGTLETRGGSEWDQANLLVSLLQQAGASARFVTGTIQVPSTTVQAWLGVTSSAAAGQLLATLGLNPVEVTISVGGAPTPGFRFDHVWVEAAPSAAGPWTPFDPSWKFKDRQPGVLNLMPNVFFDENAFLLQQGQAGQSKLTPAEFYANQASQYLLTNAPGTSLADVMYDGPIRQLLISTPPTALPYTLASLTTTLASPPSSMQSTLQITLSQSGANLFQRTLTLSADSLKRIVIEYTDAGGGTVTPKLVLDGVTLDQGANIVNNSAVTLTLLADGAGSGSAPQTFSYNRLAGQFIAIGVNALQSSSLLRSRQQAAITDAATASINGTTIDPDKQIGAVLALTLFDWMDRTTKSEKLLNALMSSVPVYAGSLTIGIASANPSVSFTNTLQIPAIPSGLALEIANYFPLSIDFNADNTFNPFRRHVLSFSAAEAQNSVLEELFNTSSMSTIKSFELANGAAIPIYTITSSAHLAQLNASPATQLTLDADTQTLIQNELAGGATVQVPKDPTPLGSFNGVGLLITKAGKERYLIHDGASPTSALQGAILTGSPAALTSMTYSSDAAHELHAGAVDVATGNLSRNEVDFNLPGIGMPLALTRHYDSQSTIDRGLGAGWMFSYGDFLTFNGNGSIGWTDDQGRLHTFTPNGAGGYVAPNTIFGAFTGSAGTTFTYRDPHGLEHRFDGPTGRLTAVRDRFGNGVDVAYDAGGNISSVTEVGAATRRLNFIYTSGRITSVNDNTGRSWTYAYTGSRLTQATDPAGASTQYTYFTDTALGGLLRQVTHPGGAATNYSYYANRRAFQVTDPKGATRTYSYNLYRYQTTAVDERGNLTLFAYDSAGHVTGITHPDGGRETFGWTNNLKTSATDVYGFTQSYQYDANGMLTQITDRAGNVTTMTYGTAFNLLTSVTRPGPRVTNYSYDAGGNLLSITDALGNVTSMTYDARGQMLTKTTPRGSATPTVGDFTTTFTYNDGGQILTRATDLPSTESYTYDARGRMLTYTDARGNVTTYTYDLRDRLLTITDALGRITTHAYDAAGNRTSTTDALGRLTQFTFDLKGQLVKTIYSGAAYSTLQYDAAGNLIAGVDELGRPSMTVFDRRNRRIQSILADGSSSQTRYDAGGRAMATTDANGNVTKFTYDKLGRVVSSVNALGGTTSYTYDAVGNLLTSTDPLAHATQYQYDAVNRLTRVTDPLGFATNYAYDANGNRISITDPLNHATLFSYDRRDRLIITTDALSRSVTRTLDAAGNVLTIVDPNANSTAYTYDALQRVVSQTNAIGATQTYTYDFVGNLTATTDFTGKVVQYTYDARNRRSAERWLDVASAVIRTISFNLDPAGQLTNAGDADSKYAITYDRLGRRLTEDNFGTPGVPNVQTQYTYDAAGNVLAVRDLYGGSLKDDVSQTFDKLNCVTRVNQVSLSHSAVSQLSGVSWFATSDSATPVVAAAYTYDNAGRLTQLRYTRGATTHSNSQWTYDAAGRIIQQLTPDGSSSYTYDNINQLVTATSPSESFSYDANGNRSGGGFTSGSGNRLFSDGTNNYAYDNAGNLTSQTTVSNGNVTEFTWDHRNRLTRATFKNSAGAVLKTVDYTYDVFDRRIAKAVDSDGPGLTPAVPERYVYHGNRLALQFDASGTLTHHYVYGPGGRLLTDNNAAGTLTFLLTDNLGTIRDLTNASGTVIDHISYSSFGKVTAETVPATNFLFGYRGQALDRETGLVYFGQRYYSPAVGRYLSFHPLSFGGGDANLYRSAGNNPFATYEI